MAARTRFSVEVETLKRNASTMNDVLEQAKNEFKELNTTMDTLNSAWSGPSNDAFRKAFAQDFIDAAQCIATLQTQIRNIESAGENYRTCELAVLDRVRAL